MTVTDTLSNGIRVVARTARSNVSYIGVLINAGSRDDGPDTPGLAHFVEHTIFKGTESKSSRTVSSRMESIGGELNAYTTKEETLIYTNAQAGYAARALELLSDLVANATFPKNEIDLERNVIIEEILSYRDNPSEAVFDEYEELIYAGSDLAHNILGSEESVSRITGADARAFIERNYTPDRMVVYIVDPGKPAANIALAEKYFGRIKPRPSALRLTPPPTLPAPFLEVRHQGNHQANTVAGIRAFGRRDPRRFPFLLLANILGGPAMNSRLNLELRERRGLVYTVDCYPSMMTDCGSLAIYFGSDPDKVAKCLGIIKTQLGRLAADRIADRTFHRLREQYCGQLLVAGDNNESSAMALAKSLMYYGEVHDSDYSAARVREVTADSLRDVAATLAETPLSAITLD